jgi:hypothetical protein
MLLQYSITALVYHLEAAEMIKMHMQLCTAICSGCWHAAVFPDGVAGGPLQKFQIEGVNVSSLVSLARCICCLDEFLRDSILTSWWGCARLSANTSCFQSVLPLGKCCMFRSGGYSFHFSRSCRSSEFIRPVIICVVTEFQARTEEMSLRCNNDVMSTR